MKINLKHHPSEHGQSMVELALTITILMILLAGVIDMGRAFFTYMAMRDAAQEGAAYGSLNPYDESGIRARVWDNLDQVVPDPDHPEKNMHVQILAPEPRCLGSMITVNVNYPDFHVDISSLVLKQTTSGSLSSGNLNIQPYIEQPVATLTPDSVLTERRLDTRVLTLNLTEEEFLNYATLQPSNFTLINPPAGLSIQSATGINKTRVNLDLQFIYNDFDVSITNFQVSITSAVLLQTKTGSLSSNTVTILAQVENPVATLTADSVLTERRLDWRRLTINLTDEERLGVKATLQKLRMAITPGGRLTGRHPASRRGCTG